MKNSPLLLGYDLGSSSVKASVIAADSGEVLAAVTYPKEEMAIASPKPGWAEQDPATWWENICQATRQLAAQVPTEQITAIGIAYQMHGLVAVDEQGEVLRSSIIWCDSRAVQIGQRAFEDLGEGYCLGHLLNSPGNFTASKLKWVQEHEPALYKRIHKVMLPGDYVAMKMSGKIQTTVSGLSEGIFWDFKEGKIADKLLDYYGIAPALLPEVVETFSPQAELSDEAAATLGLKPGIPIAYRAGDQPNNAFSLNVLQPGEVAATAGTSGVVYGIADRPEFDAQSRVNAFVHVNHQPENPRYGVLLCLNGTGILNSWAKNQLTGIGKMTYEQMNAAAATAPIGAEGVRVLPFGNGAERILANRNLGAQLLGIDLNRHHQGHLFRAMQEGIVFALNYGFQIMHAMGVQADTVKAGHANMFLSPVFRQTFANATGAKVVLYNTDGSQGAARGAGVGIGLYPSTDQAFNGLQAIMEINPQAEQQAATAEAYQSWEAALKLSMQR